MSTVGVSLGLPFRPGRFRGLRDRETMVAEVTWLGQHPRRRSDRQDFRPRLASGFRCLGPTSSRARATISRLGSRKCPPTTWWISLTSRPPTGDSDVRVKDLVPWGQSHGRSTAHFPRRAALYDPPLVILPQTPGAKERPAQGVPFRGGPRGFLEELLRILHRGPRASQGLGSTPVSDRSQPTLDPSLPDPQLPYLARAIAPF